MAVFSARRLAAPGLSFEDSLSTKLLFIAMAANKYYLDRAHDWIVELHKAWGKAGRLPSD